MGLADRGVVLVRFFSLTPSFSSFFLTTSEVDNDEVDHESGTTEELFLSLGSGKELGLSLVSLGSLN